MQQKPPVNLLAPVDAQAIPVPAGQQIDIVRVAAALVSAAVIIAGLYYGRDVLIPLACACLHDRPSA